MNDNANTSAPSAPLSPQPLSASAACTTRQLNSGTFNSRSRAATGESFSPNSSDTALFWRIGGSSSKAEISFRNVAPSLANSDEKPFGKMNRGVCHFGASKTTVPSDRMVSPGAAEKGVFMRPSEARGGSVILVFLDVFWEDVLGVFSLVEERSIISISGGRFGGCLLGFNALFYDVLATFG